MPSFLDRHDVAGATGAELREAHRLDLDAQEAHDVRFLAYWFDGEQGTASCLADAPDSAAVTAVHAQSHGGIPSEIIEVDKESVLAFLGRIDEPVDAGSAPEFVPDSPFRTIMMTDIVDSVLLTIRDGEQGAVELLSAHDEVVTGSVGSHGGRLVKHTGDGVLAVFDRNDDALMAASEIHEGIAALDAELHVRIGVNTGNPVDRSGDLFGLAVQIAARLCDEADAGQTLMSGITAELCGDPGLRDRCHESDRVVLKGLPAAILTFRLD